MKRDFQGRVYYSEYFFFIPIVIHSIATIENNSVPYGDARLCFSTSASIGVVDRCVTNLYKILHMECKSAGEYYYRAFIFGSEFR